MMSFQLSPLGGTALPCPSVADPENEITSSTFQVVPAAGVSIRAVGGVPAVMVTVSVALRPLGSVTRSRTVYASPVV
jgi:hypothetical protein